VDAVEFQELELVGGEVEEGYCSGGGPIKCTGVDDSHSAFAVVVTLVGVAVEEVVVLGNAESMGEGAFMAMEDANSLVFECHFYGGLRPRQTEGLEVGAPGRAGLIGVAPNEPAGAAGELFKDFEAAYVAAVHDALGAGPVEEEEGLADGLGPAVAV
jgi:hypothetical protein